jgi:hypothetical protein
MRLRNTVGAATVFAAAAALTLAACATANAHLALIVHGA